MSTRDGGKPQVRDVMGYCPPTGPTNINDQKSPGLHGANHGHYKGGMEAKGSQTSGGPGIGGKIYPCGTQ